MAKVTAIKTKSIRLRGIVYRMQQIRDRMVEVRFVSGQVDAKVELSAYNASFLTVGKEYDIEIKIQS